MSDIFVTLEILDEALKKKIKNLSEILDYTMKQTEILAKEPFDTKHFETVMKNKQHRIDAIKQIDEGFEPLYNRIGGQIKANSVLYKEQISSLQQKVKEIGELIIEIQIAEKRNEMNFSIITSGMKNQVKKFRTSKKVVQNYAQNYKKQYAARDKSFFDSKQ